MTADTSVNTIPAPCVRSILDTPQPYETTWQDMRRHTRAADKDSPDEIWFMAHEPVFTQGTNGRPEHVLMPGTIPIVKSDRGGQVTYHGPGQLMAYIMADLRRLGLGVRTLVQALEQATIDTLAEYGITACAKRDAPGVYVPDLNMAKIASIGLRIRNGRCYHGLALNTCMDLTPFERIDPCGFQGLQMTQLSDLGGPTNLATVSADLLPNLCRQMGLPKPTTGTNV